ncbi:KDO2-lipid IV(A) lauroyltransferase [Pseudonocardia thermophila]|uniref:KDO2-lipid IV(A) lauroyltransferase n=1 Tax=Pseudonocardia thermophila TaxID=1848 RepID=A0A1M6Z348_PSETH|nr:phosphatidylinositol mannoside acyltransferase [Pseudonocardia thermophila]SHL24830.1 KDO2-lipid IV(A) lauroyltransferase [Pseudonocardia thermophila]
MSVGQAAARLADLQYAAGWRMVRAVPEPLARRAFEAGAGWVARRGGAGPAQLRANLARLVPDAAPDQLDALVVAGMRSYGRYWSEVFRLSAPDVPRIHARTRMTGPGLPALLAAIADGTPTVVALPHSGNWDAAGAWLVEQLRQSGREPVFTTVAERLRPEAVYRRFVGYRRQLGMEVVAAGDSTAAHRALTGRLRGGGVVCLVADRDVTGGGVPVDLLGAPARLPAGPARLAALTGALLLPVCPRFAPDGWAVTVAEPVPVADRGAVPAAVQALADVFCALLRAKPEDWHALQPVWTADVERVAEGAGAGVAA